MTHELFGRKDKYKKKEVFAFAKAAR